jgi:hypothetical protein
MTPDFKNLDKDLATGALIVFGLVVLIICILIKIVL